MIRRAPVSRTTWYWNGGSAHFFRWGVHVKHRGRRKDRAWRHWRLAFFTVKRGVVRVVDYSYRHTLSADPKRFLKRPCWRFYAAFKVGRTDWQRDWPTQPAPPSSQPVSDREVALRVEDSQPGETAVKEEGA